MTIFFDLPKGSKMTIIQEAAVQVTFPKSANQQFFDSIMLLNGRSDAFYYTFLNVIITFHTYQTQKNYLKFFLNNCDNISEAFL